MAKRTSIEPKHCHLLYSWSGDMYDLDPASEVWARLRTYLASPALFNNAETQRAVYTPNGEIWREPIVPYPPASERQLRQTEAELGFPLPSELRQFYAEVANGGRNLGRTDVLHGAAGGCPERGVAGGNTIGQLVWRGEWQLHPRLEEALLRHIGRSILVDSPPGLFLRLGEEEGYNMTTLLDVATGRIYLAEYSDTVQPADGPEQSLYWLCVWAPSLGAWFADWLDERTSRERTQRWPYNTGKLMPDHVDTVGLPNSGVIWRGTYRYSDDWWFFPKEPNEEDDGNPFGGEST
jgi:hypothetical protein